MRWLWLVVALVAAPKSALAFCRTTTNLDFVPTDATPCDTTGKPLFWASRCVEVRVLRDASRQASLATIRTTTAGAFAKWASVSCDPCGVTGKPSLVVTEAGQTDCAFGYLKSAPNTNVVVFRDSGWTHDIGMLALTTVSFRKDTGEIVDADIEVNSDPSQQKISTGAADPTAFDLDSILTHEAGHLLGLAHSPVADATMRPRYDQGDLSLRDLAPDDVCGVCAAAPPGRDAPCNGTSSATCATSPDAGTEPTPSSGSSGGGCSAAGEPARSGPAGTLALVFLGLFVSRLRSRTARARRSLPSSCTRCSR